MNIAIVVEGQTDLATYPVLIQKIRNDVEVVLRKQCWGRVETKFVNHLKYFQTRRDKAIQRVFVIRDSDCADPHPLEAKLSETLDRSGCEFEFQVYFYATKCKLESLLLADEDAINHVAQNRSHPNTILRVDYSCETEDNNNAKKLFLNTLSRVELPNDERVYSEIAQASDVQIIAERCPYFRQFISRLRSD